MDNVTTGTFRAGPSRPPLPPACAGGAVDPGGTRAQEQPADVPGAPPGADLQRIGRNALASGTALGTCFGTASAVHGALRALPGVPRPIQALTGMLPMMSVYLTPWVEQKMRQALGTTATLPAVPSLAHDSAASLVLFAFNAACLYSRRLPKFPPATLAGMAATVVQVSLASVAAGATSEALAQVSQAQAAVQAALPPAVGHTMDLHTKGVGRVRSQVPAALLNAGLAASGQRLPPALALLPTGVVTGGWVFRRVLAPQDAAPTSPQGPDPARARRGVEHLPFPVTDIPPA